MIRIKEINRLLAEMRGCEVSHPNQKAPHDRGKEFPYPEPPQKRINKSPVGRPQGWVGKRSDANTKRFRQRILQTVADVQREEDSSEPNSRDPKTGP
jgi:hypothetical protein